MAKLTREEYLGENPSYQVLYPHPAQGLDAEAARLRVEATPEVMPPQPKPAPARFKRRRERFGMRLRPLAFFVGAAFVMPVLLRRRAERQVWRRWMAWEQARFRLARRVWGDPFFRVFGGSAPPWGMRRWTWPLWPRGYFAPAISPQRHAMRPLLPAFFLAASRPWGKRRARFIALRKR